LANIGQFISFVAAGLEAFADQFQYTAMPKLGLCLAAKIDYGGKMRYLFVTLSCLLPTLASAQIAARPASVGVSSLALQDVGPWGAAALPQGMAALSSDLWRGADPSTLAVAFTKVSPDQRFPSLQVVVRQAIFSGGAAPTSDPDVARTRFEAANRVGPSEAAARLIFAVPRLASDSALGTLAIDAGLSAGRIEDACGLIEAVQAPAQGTIWLESRAACYALNNEPAAANLSVDLARTRGLTDTWLSRAIAAVSGPLTAPPPFRIDSGRAIALSLRGGLKPPLTLAASPDGAALSALARNNAFMETLTPDEKIALIKNGAARGVLPLELAAQPLLAPSAAPTDPLAPIIAMPPVPSIPAQLVQRILGASTLAARSVEGRLAVAELKRVMASQPGLLTLADVPVLTEAALWAGDGELASAVAALATDTINPRLALVQALYDPAKQPQIIEQLLDKAGGDPVARRLALRDAVIAWSAGMPIGGGVSGLLQQGLPTGQAGNSGLRIALDLAAARGSKGEVALLAAMALQGEEPINANPETLIVAIRALRQVGLETAARDLARDYLLANYVTLAARPTSRVRLPATTTAPIRPTRPPATTPGSRPPPRAALPVPPQPAPTPTNTKPSWGTP
jgi:hypothetical protein